MNVIPSGFYLSTFSDHSTYAILYSQFFVVNLKYPSWETAVNGISSDLSHYNLLTFLYLTFSRSHTLLIFFLFVFNTYIFKPFLLFQHISAYIILFYLIRCSRMFSFLYFLFIFITIIRFSILPFLRPQISFFPGFPFIVIHL